MRTKPADRRMSLTRKIHFEVDGAEKKILITIGFDQRGKPVEVFCADFKAGTALHSIVQDACILFSRLLQHGDTPDELEQSLCSQPHSLIGIIAKAVAETNRE